MLSQDRAAIALTILLVLLGTIVFAGLNSSVDVKSIGCVVIIFAAGAVAFHELRALKDPAHWEQRQRSARSSRRSGSTPWYRAYWAYSASRGFSAEERRGALELRPDDSIEQIARVMVTTSFREATMKYHPDHGGSSDLMGRIVQARTLLLRSLAGMNRQPDGH